MNRNDKKSCSTIGIPDVEQLFPQISTNGQIILSDTTTETITAFASGDEKRCLSDCSLIYTFTISKNCFVRSFVE